MQNFRIANTSWLVGHVSLRIPEYLFNGKYAHDYLVLSLRILSEILDGFWCLDTFNNPILVAAYWKGDYELMKMKRNSLFIKCFKNFELAKYAQDIWYSTVINEYWLCILWEFVMLSPDGAFSIHCFITQRLLPFLNASVMKLARFSFGISETI